MRYPKGYLVSIGGAEDKGDETRERENGLKFLKNGILSDVVALLKGDEPTIVIITSASSVPEESFQSYQKAFTQLGNVRVRHLEVRDIEAANDKKTIELLQACSGVMFSGGDQERLISLLGGTAVCQVLKERYEQDAVVIAGASAGAAAMSAVMMNGGDSEKAN